MKQYVIDELRSGDYKKIRAYLDDKFGFSDVNGLYKIPIGPEGLNSIQVEHTKCQPHYFAMNLEPDHLACELLVRTDSRIRCDCIGYASEEQRNRFIEFVELIMVELNIAV
jgi:hypothetical protein